MDYTKIASYLGALIAVAFGVALIWLPPTTMLNTDGTAQSGTVGAAFSFVTIGLAGFGLAVALPAVREQARREARMHLEEQRRGNEDSR